MSPNAVPLATVTGLHDVDEYMQAQLLLAVSSPGGHPCPPLPFSSLPLPQQPPPYPSVLPTGPQHCYACLEARGLLCSQGEPWRTWESVTKGPGAGHPSPCCLPHPTDIPRPRCNTALRPTAGLLLQCALCQAQEQPEFQHWSVARRPDRQGGDWACVHTRLR